MPPPKVDPQKPRIPVTPVPPPKPSVVAPEKKRAAEARKTADTARTEAARAQTQAQQDDKKARAAEQVNKEAQKEKAEAEKALAKARGHRESDTPRDSGQAPRPGDTARQQPPDKRVRAAEDKVSQTSARAAETSRDARVARERAETSQREALKKADAALSAQKAANTGAKAAGLREPFPRANEVRDVYDAGSLDTKAQQRLFGARTPVTPSQAAKADAQRVAEATQRSPRAGAEELSRQLSLSTDPKYQAALTRETSPQTDRMAASLKDPKTRPEDATATVKELARSASLGGKEARSRIAQQLHQHGVSAADVVNADSKDGKVAALGTELARQQLPTEPQHAQGYRFSLERGPATVEFSKEVDQRVKRENGFVTATVEAETSLTVGGQVSVERATVGAELSAGLSRGEKMSYEFKVTEADYERIKKGELPPPNPLDPSTLPDKGSVKIEQSQLTGTALEAGVRYHALELGTQDSTKHGKGTSIEVSRDKNKVQVTQGPTEFFEGDHGPFVGARIGDWSAKAHLGRKDSLSEYKLRTAEFDLGTNEGKQAFEKYQDSGQIPEKPVPGVDKTLRVDKVNYESQVKLGITFSVEGPLEHQGLTGTGDELKGGAGGGATLTTGKNTVEAVVEHRPDGTRAVTLQDGHGDTKSTATFKSEFDKNGKPIPGKDEYEVTLNPPQLHREALVYAWTGDAEKARRAKESGGPVTVKFTGDDLARIRERAHAATRTHPMGLHHDWDVKNDMELVHKLITIPSDDVAQDSLYLNDPARPGGRPLPGTIQW